MSATEYVPPRPVAIRVHEACIPAAMRTERRWVVWRYVLRPDRTGDVSKWTKVPYQPQRPQSPASSTDATTWGTCDQALATYERGDADGVGFVLGDGWAGVDLDHVLDPASGRLARWAQAEVDAFATYAEISPSRTGIHLLLHGRVPDASRRKRGDVEVYSSGRYFTVTGHHLDGALGTVEARQDVLEAFCARHFPPIEVPSREIQAVRGEVVALDDEALLAKALSANDGGKFAALWKGDTSGYPSPSEAVAALLFKLAFWTRHDAGQMDRLFRRSGLMSEKWDSRRGDSTWGAREIANAMDDVTYVYQPPYTRAATDSSGERPHAPPSSANRTSTNTPPPPRAVPLPKPLAAEAYHGVLGQIARDLEPYIEADSAALLVALLTTSGVALGRGPYVPVTSGQRSILFTAIVAETGDNKSDSWWPIQEILAQLAYRAVSDHSALAPRRFGGLSTGEGLLHQIRDARQSEDGTVTDPGVEDKRLLIVEPELARVLAVMYREGNTLSMTLRELYDSSGEVRSSPKGNPIIATGAHVGLIGHITPRELQRKLREVELFNGFANRFLWVLTRRTQSLPNPPVYSTDLATKHAQLLAAALAKGRALNMVTRDEQAAHVWGGIYEALRTGVRDGTPWREGLTRDVCARAHVHVTRMALVFAALDGSQWITQVHLAAALAIWDYCEASAAYLFSNVSGDPIAEVIYTALVERGPLSRTDISGLFGRHVSKADIDGALESLRQDGRARSETQSTSGRPTELWHAIKPQEAGGELMAMRPSFASFAYFALRGGSHELLGTIPFPRR